MFALANGSLARTKPCEHDTHTRNQTDIQDTARPRIAHILHRRYFENFIAPICNHSRQTWKPAELMSQPVLCEDVGRIPTADVRCMLLSVHENWITERSSQVTEGLCLIIHSREFACRWSYPIDGHCCRRNLLAGDLRMELVGNWFGFGLRQLWPSSLFGPGSSSIS